MYIYWDYRFVYNYLLHLESLNGATFNLLPSIKSLKSLVLSSKSVGASDINLLALGSCGLPP